MTPKFERAIDFVLKHEGGYVNHPLDPGGETNFGISKRSYPNEDIRNLTVERAKEIYFQDWWQAHEFEYIPGYDVPRKIFDLAVNVGLFRASCFLQEACNSLNSAVIKVDGKIGQNTRNAVQDAINGFTEEVLYRAICHYAAAYYSMLGKPTFLRGWLRRAFA